MHWLITSNLSLLSLYIIYIYISEFDILFLF